MLAGSDVSNSRCVPAGSEVSNSRCAKIASEASWVCFWLVFGAPEGFLRLVLGLPRAFKSRNRLDGSQKIDQKKNTMRKNDLAIYHFSLLVDGS